MKTYGKILGTTLPLLLVSLVIAVGIIYYSSLSALTHLAEEWLETKLAAAVRIAKDQEAILHRYGLENIPASVKKAQYDTGREISAIKVGKAGFIFAVDESGVITLHPDQTMVGSDISQNPWFRNLQPNRGKFTISKNNKQDLALYEFFPSWQWIIIAADPEDEVYGALKRIKPFLLSFGIFSAVVIAGALMLLTRRLTAPLRELTSGAELIGRGNLNTRIKLQSRDEFGSLAVVFNKMAEELQVLLEKLESRVEDRTRELTETNRRLVQEVKDRKLAVEELRASERQLSAILRASPVGIGLVIDRKIHWVNDTMCTTFGYEHGDVSLIGHDTRCLYPDETEFRRVGSVLYQMISESGVAEMETRMARKDGTEFDCRLRGSQLDPADPGKGHIVSITDISESKSLEIKLQQAKKMEAIGSLAGGVAHDLNNILSGLVSYPELLMIELPENSPLRAPLLTIKKSGEQAAAIVQDLLTMARRGVATTEILNLNDIVKEISSCPEFLHLKILYPLIKFQIKLGDTLSNIHGSAPHVSKSIMNLIINAAEAMKDGGLLQIATENRVLEDDRQGYESIPSGEYSTISVSDQGPGIGKAELEQIFEPFYTRKRMGRSGSGLGLAVVWGTVKDHGGYIDIDSKENHGTTFRLYFPATGEMIRETEVPSLLQSLTGNGEPILIVDDSKAQREIARGILEKLGYSVATCRSGEEAIDHVRTNHVELILLDMIMDPGIDGLETYRLISKFKPDQKVIIASGFSETDRVKAIQNSTSCLYIRKPYSIETIGLALKETL